MNPKILLVDDNDDLLLITQIILKGQGYEPILAHNFEEAEKKLRIHQPLLMLLDVKLCDEDGRQLCTKIKTDAATCGVRIILMSGDDSYKDAMGDADDFLAKPFDFEELVTKVQNQVLLVSA